MLKLKKNHTGPINASIEKRKPNSCAKNDLSSLRGKIILRLFIPNKQRGFSRRNLENPHSSIRHSYGMIFPFCLGDTWELFCELLTSTSERRCAPARPAHQNFLRFYVCTFLQSARDAVKWYNVQSTHKSDALGEQTERTFQQNTLTDRDLSSLIKVVRALFSVAGLNHHQMS